MNDGAELRILLQPRRGPALRTVPSEKELERCVGGSGLEQPEQEILKVMRRLPFDP